MKMWMLRCPHRNRDRSRSRGLAWLCCCLCLGTTTLVRGHDESLGQRRARVNQLTADEKLELQRKQERFESLPIAERERLRQLHVQLESRPDSEQLLQVLRRYDQWLGSLQSGQRAKLLALPPRSGSSRSASSSGVSRRACSGNSPHRGSVPRMHDSCSTGWMSS